MSRMPILTVSSLGKSLESMELGRKYDSIQVVHALDDLVFSPPAIDISSTDSLVVHATNSISEPVTLHHHGMFFNSTTWFDGALGVSQWYVPYGNPVHDLSYAT
jgi:hypothetical protein